MDGVYACVHQAPADNVMKAFVLLGGPQGLVGSRGPWEEGRRWVLWGSSAGTPENNPETRLSLCLKNGGKVSTLTGSRSHGDNGWSGAGEGKEREDLLGQGCWLTARLP